jgi:hypothetical protein
MHTVIRKLWCLCAFIVAYFTDLDAGKITNQTSVDGTPDETKVSALSGSSETNNYADALVICTI